MFPMQQYVLDKISTIILTMFIGLFVFGLINSELFFIFRKKVRLYKRILGSLLMSMPFSVLPFFVEYFFAYPEVLNYKACNIIMLPLPFFLFLYYAIYRHVFCFHREETLLALESVLTGQYFSMLLFMILSDAWGAILHTQAHHIAINLAALSCSAILLLLYFVARKLITKAHFYIELPRAYHSGKSFKTLCVLFISVTSNYLLLIGACLLQLNRAPSMIANVGSSFLYVILLIILCYRIVNGLHKSKLQIVQWQAVEMNAYIDSMIQAINEFRGVKHDINNILQVYEGFIATKDIAGLKAYHRSIMQTTMQINSSLALIEQLRPRAALYNMLNLKIGLSQELSVCIEIQQADALCCVDINDLDLCRVFSDLLDHAVEAAFYSGKKYVCLKCESALNSVTAILSHSTDGCEGADGYAALQSYALHAFSRAQSILALHAGCTMYTRSADDQFTIYLKLNSRNEPE